MTDDTPLADLSEQLQKVSDGTGGGGDAATTPEEIDVEAPEVVETEPSFSAEEAERGPVFPREATWERYGDAITEIETVLADHGVENAAGREFDDAVLRIAARNPEAVAELILEARAEGG